MLGVAIQWSPEKRDLAKKGVVLLGASLRLANVHVAICQAAIQLQAKRYNTVLYGAVDYSGYCGTAYSAVLY